MAHYFTKIPLPARTPKRLLVVPGENENRKDATLTEKVF